VEVARRARAFLHGLNRGLLRDVTVVVAELYAALASYWFSSLVSTKEDATPFSCFLYIQDRLGTRGSDGRNCSVLTLRLAQLHELCVKGRAGARLGLVHLVVENNVEQGAVYLQ